MSASCESLIPDVLPYVAGPEEEFKRPPEGLIIHTLRRSAEFFLRSTGLLRDTYCADVQCGVREVPFIIPPGRELLRVVSVKLARDLSPCVLCPPDGTVTGTFDGHEMYTLDHEPLWDQQDGVCFEYTYTTDLSVCAAPEWMADARWRDTVVAITLMRMWEMVHMDWGDMRAAAAQRLVVNKLLAQARGFASNHGARPARPRVSAKLGGMFWGV